MNPFADLNDIIAKGLAGQPKLSDEKYYNMTIDDIVEWAEEVSGQWNGDESGRQEDQAHQANDIIEKCNELKELISGMEEL